MEQVLIKQPEFGEKSPQEIYKSIEKDGFAQFIIHNPRIQLQQLQSKENFDSSGIVSFGYGSVYIIGIKNTLEICLWKRSETEIKKIDLSEQISKQKQNEHFLVSSLNPFGLLSRFGSEKRQSKGIYNITKFEINKEGTFGILVADDLCFAILVEIGEIRPFDQTVIGVINTIAIVQQKLSSESKTEAFEFFLGNTKGSLYYGVISIKDKTLKRIENNIFDKIEKLKDFLTPENQTSTINGIFLARTLDKNHLFVSVDKKLFHLQNNTSFDNFTKNALLYFQQAKIILECSNLDSILHGFCSNESGVITLFMIDRSIIRYVTLNTTENVVLREELPIFDANGKLTNRLDVKFKHFFVTEYHFGFVFENAVIIANSIQKDVRFKQNFDLPIKHAFKNSLTNNLMLFVESKLFELKIDNELAGSWIHLVERNMEEVAYRTCERYDQGSQFEACGLLVKKLFGQKKYDEGVLKMIDNGFDFEMVIWKLYSFRNDTDQFFKCLFLYCTSIVENLKKEQREQTKELRVFKLRILLHFLVECLSYKYMQASRLVEIKENNSELHSNISFDSAKLNEYFNLMKTLVTENYKMLDQGIVKQIFQSHGNFFFTNLFESLSNSYYDIIFDYICFDNFSMAVKNLKLFLDFLLTDSVKISKDHRDKCTPFIELLEKFGTDFMVSVGNEFGPIVEELLGIESLILFEEKMYLSGLLFLTNQTPNNQNLKKIISCLVILLGIDCSTVEKT